MRTLIISTIALFLTSCTIYTEKRSEALSQAVFATADSVDVARFDLADKYSKEAEKLAFPPKHRIKIDAVYTKGVKKPKQKIVLPVTSMITPSTINEDCSGGDFESITIECASWIKHSPAKPVVKPTPAPQPKVDVNVGDQEEDILRLVVPEKFKDAQLLVVGSSEWDKLMEIKEFAKKITIDYKNLENLKTKVDAELLKQQQMHDQMVIDLNTMQKKLIAKDLLILKLEIGLVALGLFFLVCVWLRIKGIL